MKANIIKLSKAIGALLLLSVCVKGHSGNVYGLLVQEVEQVFSELVIMDLDG